MPFAATCRSWIRRTSAVFSRSAAWLPLVGLGLGLPAATQQTATVSGRIVRAAVGDPAPAAGVRVVLHRVGGDRQGPLDSARSGRDGGFRFATGRDTTAIYLISARWGGVEFFSGPVRFDDSPTPSRVILMVSDTSSIAPVDLGGRFLVVGAPDGRRQRTVVDLFVVRNSGTATRVARDSLSPTWSAVLPPALSHRVADAGSEISPEAVRFRGDTVLVFAPLSPGQKQLLLEHVLAADWREWVVPLGDGAEQLQVVAEEPGASVAGPAVVSAEPQVVDGRTLERWIGKGWPGGEVRVTFPDATGFEGQVVSGLVAVVLLGLLAGAWFGLRRDRRAMATAAALAAGLLIGTACSPGVPAGPLLIVDDVGDTVSLSRPPVRVVSMIPTTTEVLFAIGAGSAVVGRTTWCDYPPEAIQVPSLGDGLEPNLEAVLAVRPDLVVLYPSVRNEAAARRLRAMGVAAVQLRTDGLADLARTIRLLGNITGHDSAAVALVRRSDSALAEVSRPEHETPRVLILAWDQPPIAVGGASFLDEIVRRAGGRNAFGDLDAPSSPVSLESIAARDPDVILAVSDVPAFAARPEWQVVRAVRARRFAVVEGSEFLRPTPRAAAAVARLAAVLDSLGRP
jgi:iron complex transport system substrate-binding protein